MPLVGIVSQTLGKNSRSDRRQVCWKRRTRVEPGILRLELRYREDILRGNNCGWRLLEECIGKIVRKVSLHKLHKLGRFNCRNFCCRVRGKQTESASEDEQFVLENGPPEGSAEFVPPECRDCPARRISRRTGLKNRSGRQGIVGVVFGQRAVKFVGSRFGENLHIRATVPSLGRVKRRTRYPYRLNEVWFGRQVHDTVARSAVQAGAIDVVFVVFLPLPGGVYLIAGFLLETIIVGGSGTKRAAAWQT